MLVALDIPRAHVTYDAAFLDAAEADALLTVLIDNVAWQQPCVRLYGRDVHSPRLAAWYGDPGAVYSYSGSANMPLAWTPELSALRRRVEARVGCAFNSVLVNLYRDGRDSVGWHSDDEPELGAEPVIASLSLGARRRFLLKPKRPKGAPSRSLWLDRGSLLVMRGPTQRCWRHCLPKTARPVGPRVNLTFRQVRLAPVTATGQRG